MRQFQSLILASIICLSIAQNSQTNPEQKQKEARNQIQRQKTENEVRNYQFQTNQTELAVNQKALQYDIIALCKSMRQTQGQVIINYQCLQKRGNITQNQWIEWNTTNHRGKYRVHNGECEETIQWSTNNNTIFGSVNLFLGLQEKRIICDLSAPSAAGHIENTKISLNQTINQTSASEIYDQWSSLVDQRGIETQYKTDTIYADQVTISLKSQDNARILETQDVKVKSSVVYETVNGTDTGNTTTVSNQHKITQEWVESTGRVGYYSDGNKEKSTFGFRNGGVYVDSKETKGNTKSYIRYFQNNSIYWETRGNMAKVVNQSLQSKKNLNYSETWDLNGDLNLTTTPPIIQNLDQVKKAEQVKEEQQEQKPQDEKPEKIKDLKVDVPEGDKTPQRELKDRKQQEREEFHKRKAERKEQKKQVQTDL